MAGIDTKDSHVTDVAETLGNLSLLEYQQILARKTEFVECLKSILSSENINCQNLYFF